MMRICNLIAWAIGMFALAPLPTATGQRTAREIWDSATDHDYTVTLTSRYGAIELKQDTLPQYVLSGGIAFAGLCIGLGLISIGNALKSNVNCRA
jgi:hypothetical protein